MSLAAWYTRMSSIASPARPIKDQVPAEAADRQHADPGEERVAKSTGGADPGHLGDSRKRFLDGCSEALGSIGAALLEVYGGFDEIFASLP